MASRTTSSKLLLGRMAGFAYLWFLLMLAVMSIGMGVTAELWQTVMQREREQELLFIGHEFRNALMAYRDSDVGDGGLPERLEDLLQDPRSEDEIHHYLRKIYVDPMTGNTNWGLIRDEDGGIMGVFSLSTSVPIKQTGFTKYDRLFAGKQSYSQWTFIIKNEEGEDEEIP